MFEYLYLKDERRDIPVGVPAIAGGSAHDAIQSVICDGIDMEDAIVTAVNRIQSHEPIDELDELKTRQYVEDVVLVVENGVDALKDYEGKFVAEERVSLQHSELAQEIMGFVDLTGDNSIIEIKTKWNPFGPVKKDGTRSPTSKAGREPRPQPCAAGCYLLGSDRQDAHAGLYYNARGSHFQST